jgi:hypothetical protein
MDEMVVMGVIGKIFRQRWLEDFEESMTYLHLLTPR